MRCMVLIVCAWHGVDCDWLMLMKVWTSFLLWESFMGLWPIISTGFCLVSVGFLSMELDLLSLLILFLKQ